MQLIESPLIKYTAHLKEVAPLRKELLKLIFSSYRMTNSKYEQSDLEALIFIQQTQTFLDYAIGILAWHYSQEYLKTMNQR